MSRLTIVALAAVLTACSSGPSDSEMKTACLAEGKGGANKMMRKEMGIDSDAFCECVAKEARGKVSADGRQAMILDMQGKKHEAQKISMKMNDAEQKAFMEGGMAVMQTCMPKAFGK
jgi:hypothetical protein